MVHARVALMCVLSMSWLSSCGPSLRPSPRDDGPWLGVARRWVAPRGVEVRTYIDAAALADTGATVRVVIREQRNGPLNVPRAAGTRGQRTYQTITTAELDCQGRQVRWLSIRYLDENDREIGALDGAFMSGQWVRFGADDPLVGACIRLGRLAGRLAPN